MAGVVEDVVDVAEEEVVVAIPARTALLWVETDAGSCCRPISLNLNSSLRPTEGIRFLCNNLPRHTPIDRIRHCFSCLSGGIPNESVS